MTREQLDAIRARFDSGLSLEYDETETLLAEVERLRDTHAMAVQVSGELCEKCGWAMKFPGEKCRCDLLAEVERLTAERAAAFARGVAAMREAAENEIKCHYYHNGDRCNVCTMCEAGWDAKIRALPNPEDK